MKKNIIILGATGFLGEAITSLFLKKEKSVELYSKKGGNIAGKQVKEVDLSKKEKLWMCLKKKNVKAILYLSSNIPKSLHVANWNLFSYNIRLHREVLECWQNLNCHLIYASSCSVYNRCNRLPWREEYPVFPDNYYSMSKLVGELLFYKIAQNKDLPLTILRINAPYGVKKDHKTVINIFIERALKNKEVVLFGSGKREQDFIYIADIAQAFWLAYKNSPYGIYNIASGRTITMKKLANLIKKLSNSSSKILYSERLDPQENLKVKIDVSKAQKELNFFPKYSLEDGLKECIFKYKNSDYENRDFGRYSR